MNGSPTTFWGKLKAEGGVVLAWHPLADHCADVGAVAEALLELPLWRERLGHLAGSPLDDCAWARLAVLATLHDLGKFCISFQAKGRSDLGAQSGHVEPAVAALADDKWQESLAPLGIFGEAAFGLLHTSLTHHGKPLKWGQHDYARWKPRGGLAPMAGVQRLVEACQGWFPRAFEAGSELPESPAFEHAFAGLVTLADWIGSDVAFFPFSESPGDRMSFARRRAKDVLRAMGLALPTADRVDTAERGAFARVSAFQPSAAQRAVAELPTADRGSLAILESETGSGKTEAALAHFVRLFERGAVDGLYFALPTRTAATQIHRRIVAAMARAFTAPPPVVLAVPGYLQVDDETGQRLPGFEVLWPDEGRLRYRGWAAENPKRYLAGTIVVGTIDQVLLSSLMVSHAHLRATSLLRHLLVVDEVHASDDYMNRLLEEVLAHHALAGGHALLLSATLGAGARERLLRAGGQRASAPNLEAASNLPYPLVTYRDLGSREIRYVPIQPGGRSRVVSVSALAEMETPTAIARRAIAAARLGAKVLVLRNTVADCIETQLAVEKEAQDDRSLLFCCADTPAPHHGRFARDDRRALDEALEQRVGKEREAGGCVVVATQTVQQSLDLDADLLLTDLCPIDVLLQRIGRLHRHERTRPEGFREPRALILVPRQRDLSPLIQSQGQPRNYHGLGGVYHDLRVIEATWQAIERQPTWSIPAMNRSLVEQCLHDEALAAVVSNGDKAFDAHRWHVYAQQLSQRRMAGLNLIKWSEHYSEMTFSSNTDERIKTRLGEGDRRVLFDRPVAGPFGLPVRELSLRAWEAQGAGEDAKPENIVVEEGSVSFRFGEHCFVYSRFGLHSERSLDTKEKERAIE